MGDILSAISDDMGDYVELCRYFNVDVVYKDGHPDCYSEHAKELAERYEDENKRKL